MKAIRTKTQALKKSRSMVSGLLLLGLPMNQNDQIIVLSGLYNLSSFDSLPKFQI